MKNPLKISQFIVLALAFLGCYFLASATSMQIPDVHRERTFLIVSKILCTPLLGGLIGLGCWLVYNFFAGLVSGVPKLTRNDKLIAGVAGGILALLFFY